VEHRILNVKLGTYNTTVTKGCDSYMYHILQHYTIQNSASAVYLLCMILKTSSNYFCKRC